MILNSGLEEAISELHHALRTSRRRVVISEVAAMNCECLTVRDLAKQIAVYEENVQPEHATGEPYRNAYNALTQTHLSTLSEAGVIIYDSDRKVVKPGSLLLPAATVIAIVPPILETLEKDSIKRVSEKSV